MNIVINTCTLLKNTPGWQSHFIKNYFTKIIAANTDHSFFFIVDDLEEKYLVSKNSINILSAPKSTNILLWKIWYSYKLPALLKKYKADVFINIDSICSLKTIVPQCLLVPDISLLSLSSFYKKNTNTFFKTANSIITFSQSAKNKICKTYNVATEKVVVIYAGANEIFLPANEQQIETCKQKYTDGKEYFLFTGEPNTVNNCINLLKAFSFFKKRQKSNMQLIIATKSVSSNNPFIKSLNTYKYRNDVKIIWETEDEELIKITAAAYAFIYAAGLDNFYTPVLQAMQCGVPVIVSNTLLMNEICAEAALFTDPTIFENIADKMMLVFKDEQQRKDLITKGKIQAAKFSINLNNQLLWQHIIKCAGLTA